MARRMVPFAIVGALGFGVQTIAFGALTAVGWLLIPATVVSVEAAVVQNFFWHERWTWRDRVAGRTGRSRRLLAFVLITGLTSVLPNVAFACLYSSWLHAGPLVTSVIANGSTMFFNFLAADRVVFKCV